MSTYTEEYIIDYVKWRMGPMRPDGKSIVRQAIADDIDPEPLVFKYYQEHINPICNQQEDEDNEQTGNN